MSDQNCSKCGAAMVVQYGITGEIGTEAHHQVDGLECVRRQLAQARLDIEMMSEEHGRIQQELEAERDKLQQMFDKTAAIAAERSRAAMVLEIGCDGLQRLMDKAASVVEGAAIQNLHLIEDGHMAGWYDTMAITSNVELGDWLVEAGLWEMNPTGFGRRWFYRPSPTESEAKESAEKDRP